MLAGQRVHLDARWPVKLGGDNAEQRNRAPFLKRRLVMTGIVGGDVHGQRPIMSGR